MRKIIGYIMYASPFVAALAVIVWAAGWKIALILFGGAIGLCVLFIVAEYLINSDKK
jgi:hypothetical protein